jgi:hypothetical protein
LTRTRTRTSFLPHPRPLGRSSPEPASAATPASARAHAPPTPAIAAPITATAFASVISGRAVSPRCSRAPCRRCCSLPCAIPHAAAGDSAQPTADSRRRRALRPLRGVPAHPAAAAAPPPSRLRRLASGRRRKMPPPPPSAATDATAGPGRRCSCCSPFPADSASSGRVGSCRRRRQEAPIADLMLR